MKMFCLLNLVHREKDAKNFFSLNHIKGMLINLLGKCIILNDLCDNRLIFYAVSRVFRVFLTFSRATQKVY